MYPWCIKIVKIVYYWMNWKKEKEQYMYFKNIFFAQIGVLPNNPALTINDLDDVRQIDGLFRAHVLLAELAGRSSPDYNDYLIQAHTYLMRLWQVSTVLLHFFVNGRSSSDTCILCKAKHATGFVYE